MLNRDLLWLHRDFVLDLHGPVVLSNVVMQHMVIIYVVVIVVVHDLCDIAASIHAVQFPVVLPAVFADVDQVLFIVGVHSPKLSH